MPIHSKPVSLSYEYGQKGFVSLTGCYYADHVIGININTKVLKYSQLSPKGTPLGPALSVRLRESQIKGIKKGRDPL